MYETLTVGALIGKTLTKVEKNKDGDELHFYTTEGEHYRLYHGQGCCEHVRIEDIAGNLEDLVGSPILMADESTNSEGPVPEYADSFTWTFYKFATLKGYVDVRWLGESNGYYGEEVDFEKVR